VAEVPASVVGGMLQFEANVGGDAANGARMLYEIAARQKIARSLEQR